MGENIKSSAPEGLQKVGLYYEKLKAFVIKNFLLLIAAGFAIRIGFIIYYYFDGFGLMTDFGDIALNLRQLESTLNGNYSTYPPVALLFVYIFAQLANNDVKLFMIWAAILEIVLSALLWFVLKAVAQSVQEKNPNTPIQKDTIKLAYVLFMLNPFWILHNIFSIRSCGYHITDLFFLFEFLGVIYFHQKGKLNLAYLCLALSAVTKLFTFPAIGLYALLLFLKKDWKELMKFAIIQIVALIVVFIPTLFIFDDFITLVKFWFGEGVAIPFYIRIIPTIIIMIFVLLKLKDQDLTSLSGISLIIFFSYAVTSIPYWRYLLGLIFIGHLDPRLDKWNLEVKQLGLTLNKHEITFFLSIVGVVLSYLFIIVGWVT